MEDFLRDMAATGQPRRGEVVSFTFSDAQLFDDALTDLGFPVEGDKQRYCYGDVGKQLFHQCSLICIFQALLLPYYL